MKVLRLVKMHQETHSKYEKATKEEGAKCYKSYIFYHLGHSIVLRYGGV